MNRLKKLFDDVYIVDLTPPNYEMPFIFSYIVRTRDYLICIDQGPASQADKLKSIIGDMIGDRKLILIPTHIHLDHAGGLGLILEEVDNAVAYVHPRGLKHLVNPTKLWSMAVEALGDIADIWGAPEPAPNKALYSTEDGLKIRFNDYLLEIIFTEGHSSHHQSIFLHNLKAMFTGDSAGIYLPFLNYVMLSTPSKLDIYYHSLHKMLERNPKYLMFPHCGYTKDGNRKLMNYVTQLKYWFKVAKKVNYDREQFIKYISRFDEKFHKAIDYLSSSSVVFTLILRGISIFIRESINMDFDFGY